MLTAHIEDADS